MDSRFSMVDLYRKLFLEMSSESDEERIAEINRKVDAIKARFPKPPKRG